MDACAVCCCEATVDFCCQVTRAEARKHSQTQIKPALPRSVKHFCSKVQGGILKLRDEDTIDRRVKHLVEKEDPEQVPQQRTFGVNSASKPLVLEVVPQGELFDAQVGQVVPREEPATSLATALSTILVDGQPHRGRGDALDRAGSCSLVCDKPLDQGRQPPPLVVAATGLGTSCRRLPQQPPPTSAGRRGPSPTARRPAEPLGIGAAGQCMAAAGELPASVAGQQRQRCGKGHGQGIHHLLRSSRLGDEVNLHHRSDWCWLTLCQSLGRHNQSSGYIPHAENFLRQLVVPTASPGNAQARLQEQF
mmetsp:Transcript_165621/g.531624  ORF Transcript_165621/g.531624 Transcript_165621/m.531624 type:complete len:306 (+) Transcript_165621:620-1537(+)